LFCEARIAKNTFRLVSKKHMTRTKNRTARHNIWLTPAEKNAWKEKAATAGMNLNEYIRHCVERRKIPEPQPEVNRQTAVELGRIGVNLNQLQRAMNTAIASGQNIPNLEESLAVVKKVYEAVRTLQGELLFRDRESQKNKAPGVEPGGIHLCQPNGSSSVTHAPLPHR
jgi:hypothetical protein